MRVGVPYTKYLNADSNMYEQLTCTLINKSIYFKLEKELILFLICKSKYTPNPPFQKY